MSSPRARHGKLSSLVRSLLAVTTCWIVLVAGGLAGLPTVVVFGACCCLAVAHCSSWGAKPARSLATGALVGLTGFSVLGGGVNLVADHVLGSWRPSFILPPLPDIVAIALLAPMFEETIYRGPLLEQLVSRLGAVTSVTATSVLFAIPHTEPCLVFGAMAIGLLLGTFRVWGASLAYTMGLHAGVNWSGLLAAGIPRVLADAL